MSTDRGHQQWGTPDATSETVSLEHVLDMMMYFNIVEVNGGVIDEANQNLIKDKEKEVEANVATTKRKFSIGSSSKSKAGPSKPNTQIVILDDVIDDPLTYKQTMNDVNYDLKKWLATHFQMKDLGNAQNVLGLTFAIQ
ncbi:gag/pol protein [Cucumis melo var. makuwa]|uniref:Gag/pol protein n=1 Tax=Cucumis melo var. makuwa TaxID=1194695 RepID=A0A5D3DHF4_CUCMM|nr:gag/pol protein [Cucumis melo var. makuwa]